MLIYGKNVCKEYLNSGKTINKCYLMNNFKDNEIISLLKKNKISIRYMDKTNLDRKVEGLHQGIILDVSDYKYYDLSDILVNNALIVMLDHIEDPHNLGAIVRTAEACGVDGIIIPNDRSIQVNSTVIKTSVGTTDKVKIVRVSNLVNTINKLKKEGFWIIGTDMKGTDYSDINYKGKTCIICGNEGVGMSRLVKENCDFIASIPMKGTVNSLNASVATGIILFEAVKNRGD